MGKRWVVGDIHGCILTFQALIKKINLQKSDTLFLLGDYIDRGPDSKAVLDYIFSLQERKDIQVKPLMGNHEYMMSHSMGNPEFFKLWMLNKGFTTLRDFDLADTDTNGNEKVKNIPEKYLNFIQGLRNYEDIPGFFLTHGCFTASAVDPLDDISSMIWGRTEIYPENFLQGKILVHGHTPAPLEDIICRIKNPQATVFNLDGGCVYKNNPRLGYLLGLELDSRTLFYIKNSD